MGPYSLTKFERDPLSRLRDLENGVCTCARADALHLRAVAGTSSASPVPATASLSSNQRRHIWSLASSAALIEWVPIHTHKNWTQSAQPFARSGERDVHVRTCRCTPPQTCVKLLCNGSLFTHKIWTQPVQPFARYERGVCTCARADSPHFYIM